MLDTARLRLIPVGAEHFDALAAMYGDPEVSRFLAGEPLDRAESWRRLALHVGHWTLRGYGSFACIEKTSGTIVGHCGPWYPEGWPALEIGYALLREFWGRGYASEAASDGRRAKKSGGGPESRRGADSAHGRDGCGGGGAGAGKRRDCQGERAGQPARGDGRDPRLVAAEGRRHLRQGEGEERAAGGVADGVLQR